MNELSRNDEVLLIFYDLILLILTLEVIKNFLLEIL